MKPRTYLLAALAVVLLQSGVLVTMIGNRVHVLRNGKEIVMESRAVDPRDLFRGHYVRLNLRAGDLHTSAVEIDRPFDFGETVYAELEKGEGVYWTTRKMWHEIPAESDAVFLEGIVTSQRKITTHRYSIAFQQNRYFVPKARALELEKLNRNAGIGVVLAVGRGGEAYIAGIMIDGEVVYDEPLL